jgi:hypothetical protein
VNKFFLKYADGTEAVVHSLIDSVEGFINEHFGSVWEHAQAAGASVTMNGIEQSQPAQAAPVDAPAVDDVTPQEEVAPEVTQTEAPSEDTAADQSATEDTNDVQTNYQATRQPAQE